MSSFLYIMKTLKSCVKLEEDQKFLQIEWWNSHINVRLKVTDYIIDTLKKRVSLTKIKINHYLDDLNSFSSGIKQVYLVLYGTTWYR